MAWYKWSYKWPTSWPPGQVRGQACVAKLSSLSSKQFSKLKLKDVLKDPDFETYFDHKFNGTR